MAILNRERNMADFEIKGDKLRSFRRARGWTQLELAITAGVSERTIRNAERGRPLRPDFLGFLASALDVEAEELVNDPTALRPARRSERLAERIVEAFKCVYIEQNAHSYLEIVHGECQLSQRFMRTMRCDESSQVTDFWARMSGSFCGADGVRRFVDHLLPWANWMAEHDHQFDLDPMRASGNLVILSGISSWVSPVDGMRVFVRGTHIYQFERERIRGFEGFQAPCDPPEARTASVNGRA
jgi:transcriptional regulator with XRE-family HTH domain